MNHVTINIEFDCDEKANEMLEWFRMKALHDLNNEKGVINSKLTLTIEPVK